jgi:hypothetical protein
MKHSSEDTADTAVTLFSYYYHIVKFSSNLNLFVSQLQKSIAQIILVKQTPDKNTHPKATDHINSPY